jgi:hypothetical protein
MAKVFKIFTHGIKLKPIDGALACSCDPSPCFTSADNGTVYLYCNVFKIHIECATRDIITNDQTQTLTNKTITIDDSNLTIIDDADSTKQAVFAISACHVACTTYTFTFPVGTDTLVGRASVDTLTNKTINDISNDVHADVTHIAVRNVTCATIPKGSPVYISGYNLGQDVSEVELSDADNAVTMPSIGLVEEDIPSNTNGEVVAYGVLKDVDTSTWAVGDVLYVDTTAGQLVNVRPTGSGELVQAVAKVIRSNAVNGRLLVQGAGRVNAFPNDIELVDANTTFKDDIDSTKQMKLELSGITTCTSRTLTVPDADTTIVGTDATQTLTNKSIDADTNTISNLETDNLKAGVLKTDTTMACATDTEIPSALAIKTYVDDSILTKDEALEIGYDDCGNVEVLGANVQVALDATDTALQSKALASDLSTHLADTTAHGTTGCVVGTTDTQSLTNKTIDGDLNTISNLAHGAEVDNPTSGVHGVTGCVVGTTDTQTLTNKTIQGASIETPERSDVKQGTECALTTYAACATDGQIVFATDTQKMYQIIGGSLEPIGGGGSSFDISQCAHGFAVGDGIYHNGTTWVKGQADCACTLAYYTVIGVPTANNFSASDFTRASAPCHGFTIGQYYFLSDTCAGTPTSTEPTSNYSNPLFFVEDACTLQIKVYRPAAVGETINLDELADVSVPSPTDDDVLTYNSCTSRWESIAPQVTSCQFTTHTCATSAHGTTGCVVGTSDTQTLTNKTLTDPQICSAIVFDLLCATPANPPCGDLKLYAKCCGGFFKLDACGNEIPVGSGGVGGINYIDNFDIEIGTCCYNTYADCACTCATDGTGGCTINVLISQETCACLVLRETGSLKFAKDAANRQGQGWSYDFCIDNTDQAKKLYISFDYDASDADYADGDIRFQIYDKTNATLIRTNGEDLKGGKGSHLAWFQTAPDSTSYRLIAHVSSTNAAAYCVYFDNIQVGPREPALAESRKIIFTASGNDGTAYTANTENVSFTETFDLTNSWDGRIFTAPYTGDYHIEGGLQATGSVCSWNIYLFTGPNACCLTQDRKIAFNGGISTVYFSTAVKLTKGEMFSIRTSDTFTGSNSLNHWLTVISNSPNQVSEDIGNREVRVEGAGNGGETITASTEGINFTKVVDTTSSWVQEGAHGTDTFIAPETGLYILTGRVYATAAQTAWSILSYVDSGSGYSASKSIGRNDGDAGDTVIQFSGMEYLNKGDKLQIVSNRTITLNSATALNHHIDITKFSMPQTVLETETVYAKYSTNAGVSIPSGCETILKYEDKTIDSHNSYCVTCGIYTVPVTGTYLLMSSYSHQGNAVRSFYHHARVNGTRVASGAMSRSSSSSNRKTVYTQVVVDVVVGDTIDFTMLASSSGSAMYTDGNFNTMSIMRIK